MSNYCEYCLKAKGEEKNVKELVQILQYKHPDLEPYRIFDAYEDECGTDNENKYFVCLSGYVAWSIISSILAPEEKTKNIPSDRKLVNIINETNRLHLVIEIFSSESLIGFQEHYIIDNGDVLVNECKDYDEIIYDSSEYEGETDDEKFKNFCKENEIDIDDPDVEQQDNIFMRGGIKNYGVWTI